MNTVRQPNLSPIEPAVRPMTHVTDDGHSVAASITIIHTCDGQQARRAVTRDSSQQIIRWDLVRDSVEHECDRADFLVARDHIGSVPLIRWHSTQCRIESLSRSDGDLNQPVERRDNE